LLDKFKCMEKEIINWENMNNSSIKMRLGELENQQNSIKDKLIKLSEKLESVEKEYLFGNKILSKRYSGE
jgi:hypothetical protein